MAIRALPILLGPLYLGDLVPEIAAMEGPGCPEAKRACVMVRQATEGDHIAVDGLYAERTTRFTPIATEEVRNVNMRTEWAMQIWLCTTDASNIEGADGRPLFSFDRTGPYGRMSHDWGDFLQRFGTLASEATRAMRYAVWEANPDWDLRMIAPRQVEGEDTEDQEEPAGEA